MAWSNVPAACYPEKDVAGSTDTRHLKMNIVSGIVTGQLAGLFALGFLMVAFALFTGRSPLIPVQMLGSVFFGEAAAQTVHLPSFLAGFAMNQLGVGLLWGLVFGGWTYLANVCRGRWLVLIGLSVGVLAHIVVINIIYGAVTTSRFGTDLWAANIPAVWSWAAFLVFGLALAYYPAIFNRVSGATPGGGEDSGTRHLGGPSEPMGPPGVIT